MKSNDCYTDDMVQTFTVFLSSKGNKYFEKRTKVAKNTYFTQSDKTMKKWFNEECRVKKNIYTVNLNTYNLNKTNESKNDYKYQCRLSKRKYNQAQAKTMNDMRNKKSKEFWKMFRRAPVNDNSENVNISSFFEHFKKLSSET
ncbi:hypothetical protein MAR_021384, partial [Mya arenaria]